MERSYIGSILCLPTASALPTGANGDFGMSLFYGQLSDKPPLACKTHMGASEANRKPRRLCRSRRVRHSCG